MINIHDILCFHWNFLLVQSSDYVIPNDFDKFKQLLNWCLYWCSHQTIWEQFENLNCTECIFFNHVGVVILIAFACATEMMQLRKLTCHISDSRCVHLMNNNVCYFCNKELLTNMRIISDSNNVCIPNEFADTPLEIKRNASINNWMIF